MDINPSDPHRPRRRCPTCDASDRTILTAVPPETFVYCNPTIDIERLRRSGLLDLPPISLARCNGCRTVATTAALSVEHSATFWDTVVDDSRSFDKIFSIEKRRRNADRWATALNALASTPTWSGGNARPVRVLDFGCGWGDFLSAAESPGVECVGVEVHPVKIASARDRGLTILETLDDLPSDFRFDILHCDQVLEHLDDPAGVLSSLSKLAAPDMVAYLAVPNYSDTRVDRAVASIELGKPLDDKDLITWDHLNFFSGETFGRLVEGAGWAAVVDPASPGRLSHRTSTWAVPGAAHRSASSASARRRRRLRPRDWFGSLRRGGTPPTGRKDVASTGRKDVASTVRSDAA